VVSRYVQVVGVLRCLLPGFLAFTAAAVLAWPAWLRPLRTSLSPALSLRGHHPAGALALLGTMLTGYVCAWKTVQQGAVDPAGTVDGRRLAHATAGAVVSAVFTAVILWSMLVPNRPRLAAQPSADVLGPV